MALTISVARGYTFTSEVRFDVDDLNAAALPTITIAGSVGSSELAASSVNSTHIKPGPIAYAVTTGSANAYVAAPSPGLSALTAGAWLILKLNFTNTGAATLNVNSLGAVALKKLADQDVEAGDLRSGAMVEVRYDGTYWQLAEPNLPDRLYGELGGTVNTYTTTLAGITIGDVSDLTGRMLVLKVGAALTNTGASTLNVNGLGAVSVRAPDNAVLSAGALTAGRFVAVTFDGANWQLLNSTSFTLPNVGPGAGAIAYPTSITLDVNGRVTAASAGSAPASTSAAMAVFDPSGALTSINTVSSDATADTVTITAHGWSDGQLIWFTGAGIGGTTAYVPYYVDVVDADTVKLHTTKAGAIAASLSDLVNISSTGAAVVQVDRWTASPFSGTPNNIDGIVKNDSTKQYFVDFKTALASANYNVASIATALLGGPAYPHHPYSTTPTTEGFWIAWSVPSVGDVASTRAALEVRLLA
jgi:hypothetical protein